MFHRSPTSGRLVNLIKRVISSQVWVCTLCYAIVAKVLLIKCLLTFISAHVCDSFKKLICTVSFQVVIPVNTIAESAVLVVGSIFSHDMDTLGDPRCWHVI